MNTIIAKQSIGRINCMFFFIDFKKDEVLRSTVCILILCMYNVTPSIVDFENSFCGQDGHQDPNGNVKIL